MQYAIKATKCRFLNEPVRQVIGGWRNPADRMLKLRYGMELDELIKLCGQRERGANDGSDQ